MVLVILSSYPYFYTDSSFVAIHTETHWALPQLPPPSGVAPGVFWNQYSAIGSYSTLTELWSYLESSFQSCTSTNAIWINQAAEWQRTKWWNFPADGHFGQRGTNRSGHFRSSRSCSAKRSWTLRASVSCSSRAFSAWNDHEIWLVLWQIDMFIYPANISCKTNLLTISYVDICTWWLIPLSKWVIIPVISGLTLLIPFITEVITHLLSGMRHHVCPKPETTTCFRLQSIQKFWHMTLLTWGCGAQRMT